MEPVAAIIRKARNGAKLTEPLMARLVGVDVRTLARLEAGEEEPTPAFLDRLACTLGVTLKQVMSGEAHKAPMRMLFRSMCEERRPTLRQLADTGAHLVLGDFARCTTALAELRELLGERPDTSFLEATKPVAIPIDSTPPHGAEERAQYVRCKLGLGAEPLPSVFELVQKRLGIDVFWATPDDLDRDIDAASVMAPSPAILVNLVGGIEQWWRTRMTLAHELCHLLFDRDFLTAPGQRGFVLFSPGSGGGWTRMKTPRSRWYFSDEFERIEQRANAFAAYFLAPRESVISVSKGLNPTSETAIVAVAREHGVGRETAINLLKNVHGLSNADRAEMANRPHAPIYNADPEGRFPEPTDVRAGLRSGVFQDVVLRALGTGKIDREMARDYLRRPLTEPLPAHPALTEELRAPLRPMQDKIRLAAERYLADKTSANAMCTGEITSMPEGYRVAVLRVHGRHDLRAAGYLWLTRGLEVSRDERIAMSQ